MESGIRFLFIFLEAIVVVLYPFSVNRRPSLVGDRILIPNPMELASKLGNTLEVTATRLGELVKKEVVAKTGEDKYKITTIGIKKFSEEFDLNYFRS